MFIALLITSFQLTGCDKESILNENQVPAEIKTYVEKHFPGKKILQCIKDKDGLELSYDVIVEGNFTLEFNRKKEIESVKGLTQIPDSVIPEKILNYVKTNYPGNYIIEWDVDRNNQQIKLDNRLELEFNKSGDFLRIDD